jgi:hypothetical protein
MMKKSTWIKTTNVILSTCVLEFNEAFRSLHGSVGLLFVVFAVIHIVQHWDRIGAGFAKSRS